MEHVDLLIYGSFGSVSFKSGDLEALVLSFGGCLVHYRLDERVLKRGKEMRRRPVGREGQ